MSLQTIQEETWFYPVRTLVIGTPAIATNHQEIIAGLVWTYLLRSLSGGVGGIVNDLIVENDTIYIGNTN